MADGYGEENGVGREEEERKRKEKKRKELVWQGKDKTQIWAHNMNKFTKMPL